MSGGRVRANVGKSFLLEVSLLVQNCAEPTRKIINYSTQHTHTHTHIGNHRQIEGGRHAALVHARLLRPNVAGHLTAGPQARRLPDARHLLAVRFADEKSDRVAELVAQSAAVDLVDGQRNGAGDGQAGSRIVEVAGPSLRAGQVAEREDLAGDGEGAAAEPPPHQGQQDVEQPLLGRVHSGRFRRTERFLG